MAVPHTIIWTIEDNSGDTATTEENVDKGFALTDYDEFAAAMSTLMNNIIEGKILRAELAANADLSGLTGNFTSGADDVEDLGSFDFDTVDGRPVNVNVPGLDESKVILGSDDLDQADVDIAAFITAMTSGIAVTGGTIIPCDVGEIDITGIKNARERFRASGSRR